MNLDQMLDELRSTRATILRVTATIDQAIQRLEAMRPVADAFQRWQEAQQAQWDALTQAGGPHQLDVEAHVRHAAEIRRAEAMLTEALRACFAGDRTIAEPEPGNDDSHNEYTHVEQYHEERPSY